MNEFLYQAFVYGSLGLFFWFYLFILVRYFGYRFLTLFYKKYESDLEFLDGKRVVIGIPVCNENPDDFRESLLSVKRGIFYLSGRVNVDVELYVIINGSSSAEGARNGERNLVLEGICEELFVDYFWLEKSGKRNALGFLFDNFISLEDFVILCDSDVVWLEDSLLELLKPFQDQYVGGVTTKQLVSDKFLGRKEGSSFFSEKKKKQKKGREGKTLVAQFGNRSFAERLRLFCNNLLFSDNKAFFPQLANKLEIIRNDVGFKFLSVFGQIACLPGRTIAFRGSILKLNNHTFQNETFLSKKVEFSDDRSLTNYTLFDGYKTVYQESALVYTDAPTTFQKYLKQQLRWARGSQLNTIKHLPYYLLQKPLLAFFFLTEMFIPFFIIFFMSNIFLTPSVVEFPSILFYIAGAIALFYLSYKIRFNFTFRQALFMTFVFPFIRIWGLASCADKNGWGTRKDAVKDTASSSLFPKLPYLIVGSIVLTIIYLAYIL